MTTEREPEKMKPYPVNFPPSLWLAARRKAGVRSLAGIIRRLIIMWLREEVVLMDDE